MSAWTYMFTSAIALAVFGTCWGVATLVGESTPWLNQAVLKTLLVAVSVAAAWAGGLSGADLGFARPGRAPWWRGVLVASALGAATSLVLQAVGGGGVPFMRRLGLGGLVLWIWLYSSVAEEIFVRGWFQGWASRRLAVRGLSAAPVTLLSATVFCAMHLSLVASGADRRTVAVILVGTWVLGWICARLRQETGSLAAPMAAHAAFNVGGFAGGIVAVVIRALAHR